MVFPFLAAAMLGSSVLGAVTGNKNAKKQIALQEQQNADNKAYNNQSLLLAKEAQRQGLATQIDANGNMSVYDQASNTWKVILTPDQQGLNDASNREQGAQLTDAVSARNQRQTQAGIRSQENDVAAGQRDQFTRVASGQGVDPNRVASALSLARTGAVNAGFDQAQQGINTQALRSGATGAAGAGTALARARAQMLAESMGTPAIEGMQMADSMNNSNMDSSANRYNLYATRGANVDNAVTNPAGVGSNLSAALTTQKQLGMNGASGAAGAYASAAQRNPKTIPDYNATNPWNGIGDIIASQGAQQMLGSIGTMFKGKTTATTDGFKKSPL